MSRQVAQPQKKRLALRRRRGRSPSQDRRRVCLFEALEGRCLFNADPALQPLLEVAEPTESGAPIPTEEITLAYTKAEWSHPAGPSEFAQAVPTTLSGVLPQAVLEVAEPADDVEPQGGVYRMVGVRNQTSQAAAQEDDLQRNTDSLGLPTEEITLAYTKAEWDCAGGVTGDAPGGAGPVTENLPMAAEDIIWLVAQYNPYDQVDGGAPNCKIMPLHVGTPERASMPLTLGVEHTAIDPARADSTGARRVVRSPEPEQRPVFKGEIVYVEPILEMVGPATSDRTLGEGGHDGVCPDYEPLLGWESWLEWLWD
jgi:hypothetical protein